MSINDYTGAPHFTTYLHLRLINNHSHLRLIEIQHAVRGIPFLVEGIAESVDYADGELNTVIIAAPFGRGRTGKN